MTTDQLQNFLATAEVLNFHRASESMYIAQPALSRQIKALEVEIGAQLFDRSKKQIKLTPAGVFFRGEVTRLLDNLEQAKKKASQIHRGEAGEVTIGHASSAMQALLPPFLKKAIRAYPSLKIGLVESTNRLICSRIVARELDFGIVPNAVVPEEIAGSVIYTENFVVVVPKQMKTRFKKADGLKAFAKADWVLPAQEDGRGYNEILYRMFQESGFTPNVIFESPNASTSLRLVSEGLGVTVIGKSAVQHVNLNIRSHDLSEKLGKIEMRFIWLRERSDELRQYISLFLKMLKDVKSGGF